MADYKEKYEMALETVQEILNSGADSIKMSRLKLILRSVFSELKESDEETITDNTNKVETKFKVGDWVVLTVGAISSTHQIIDIDINKERYWFDEGTYLSFADEKYLHFWTIKDVEDGDILSYVTDEENLWIMIYRSLYKPYENHVHYRALLVNDDFTDKGTCCIDIDYLKPATKEQRDLLFKRMLESGYKWDSNKKELISIL